MSSVTVTYLMMRTMLEDIQEDHSNIRTLDELSDFLLVHAECEDVFTPGWEKNVNRTPNYTDLYDDLMLEREFNDDE